LPGSVVEPPALICETNDTTWARKACEEALAPMMDNPLCDEGLGDQQNVFVDQCVQDVIAHNDSECAQILAEAYSGVCRSVLDISRLIFSPVSTELSSSELRKFSCVKPTSFLNHDASEYCHCFNEGCGVGGKISDFNIDLSHICGSRLRLPTFTPQHKGNDV